MEAAQIDRKTLVKLSRIRLAGQAKDIEKDLARDIEFIEDYMVRLSHMTTSEAKKHVEQQIAERMNRVDNLRISLQMIALMQELLAREQVVNRD